MNRLKLGLDQRPAPVDSACDQNNLEATGSSSSNCDLQLGDIVPEAKRVVGAEGGGGGHLTLCWPAFGLCKTR